MKVATADVRAAEASVKEAKAIYDKYEAEVERWDSEVKRLKHEVDRGIVDPQILLESTNQLKASIAARSAASATIAKAEADLLSQGIDSREEHGRRRGRPGRPLGGH